MIDVHAVMHQHIKTEKPVAIEFDPYPKTPRLNRDCIITEKIDGTNAAVGIQRLPLGFSLGMTGYTTIVLDESEVGEDGLPSHEYIVWAQSRKRVITPGKQTDNYGFAGWVAENAVALVETLGEGLHRGEWWGLGIQGNKYDKPTRFLSLFNVDRYKGIDFVRSQLPQVGIVPELYRGPFSTDAVDKALIGLRNGGSYLSEGAPAEGVIVFLSAARQVFKVLCENDALPKTLAAAA